MRGFDRSFTGGELTPQFFGQITDAKYMTGLALVRNFRILPHGPAQNRAGFEFVLEVKDSTKKTRLMPFTYSTTQTMAVEVGDSYFRFHTMDPVTLQGSTLLNGGVPYEVANPFLQADLFGIKYVQSADVFTMAHTNYPPAELRRGGALAWTYTPISFVTTLAAPTAVTIVATRGATPGTPTIHRYAVTAVASNNIDESLISIEGNATTPQALLSAITKAVPGVFTTTAAHGLLVNDPVTINSVGGMTQVNGLIGLTVGTVPSTTTFTLVQAGGPLDTSAYSTYTSGGQVFITNGVKNNLFDTGASNAISWSASVGALRYNVYKYSNGLWGYLGQASGTTFSDNNITPDISHTPPEASNPFASAGNYPGAVTYFDQRRVFAGTINQPQNMWLTRAGTESNLTYSIPTRDSDSISFRVVAREANTVRHLVPLANLVALTSSAEWRVTSVNTDSLTPSSISVKPQSYIGANDAQPVVVNNNVVYAAARGGHVREMAYQYTAGGYVTGDLSLRAPHLFDQLSIVDIAFSKAPYPIIWMVSSNGILLSLTYVPEQQIGAWARHDTDGLFESICVVAEGAEDVLYAIVNRTINGAQKRYVERMRPRVFATPADSFFVDCGGTFVSTAGPVSTITGVNWLEGKTVSILADGAVHRPLIVKAGSFTLDNPATKIQFGLPITADIQTLPLANQLPGAGQGMKKNVNKVYLQLDSSGAPATGPSFTSLVSPKIRTTEAYGSPPLLQTGEIEIVNKAAWTDSAQVCIRMSDPLPLTLVSLTLDYAMGG
jgi:hypothetical protein